MRPAQLTLQLTSRAWPTTPAHPRRSQQTPPGPPVGATRPHASAASLPSRCQPGPTRQGRHLPPESLARATETGRNPRRDPRPRAQRHGRLDPARLLYIAPRGLCASSPSQPPPQTLTLIAPPCRRASAPPRAHLPAASRPPQTPALAPHRRPEARRALARDSQALQHGNFSCAAPPVSSTAAAIPCRRCRSVPADPLLALTGSSRTHPRTPGRRSTPRRPLPRSTELTSPPFHTVNPLRCEPDRPAPPVSFHTSSGPFCASFVRP